MQELRDVSQWGVLAMCTERQWYRMLLGWPVRLLILPRSRGHTHYAEILSDFNKINSNSIGLT